MSFESNKILGAFLGTCLLLIAIGTLADLIYKKTDSIPMSKEVISYKISPNLDTSINIELFVYAIIYISLIILLKKLLINYNLKFYD